MRLSLTTKVVPRTPFFPHVSSVKIRILMYIFLLTIFAMCVYVCLCTTPRTLSDPNPPTTPKPKPSTPFNLPLPSHVPSFLLNLFSLLIDYLFNFAFTLLFLPAFAEIYGEADIWLRRTLIYINKIVYKFEFFYQYTSLI